MTSLSEQDLKRLAAQRTIDLTTFGRRSGLPRRIEIWWFHVDGRFVITGTPGRRDWLANVKARPEVIIHAGGMDIPAAVRPITDTEFRRRLFTDPEVTWYRTQAELDHLIADAPMIEVLFEQ
ncbi:MAG TPA: nitroreductase family deazaflavin-dependent oxidoreductase [Acidimicrobiia bacterium]|nr:nitroreductase family deazaflavin-dependent oxidoreductase [Acidimicrobiia bacterium]